MEKATLVFIGLLLFSTCKKIISHLCKNDSDCKKICGNDVPVCQYNVRCVCITNEPLTNQQACIDHCKSIGEIASLWIPENNKCYCRKPLM
ncbi:hypothetical protein BRARA_K00461 [Brassica rapa]|uniref:Uncharacterized protein n=1 Tax=Brassica campestris TaxID=3711 RepID=A0A397L3C5_BRACM|nr:hypothetical protein BRARA_K00461 [Brassica rapa]VDC82975.1 unnamed protein product [Brassica rapa]